MIHSIPPRWGLGSAPPANRRRPHRRGGRFRKRISVVELPCCRAPCSEAAGTRPALRASSRFHLLSVVAPVQPSVRGFDLRQAATFAAARWRADTSTCRPPARSACTPRPSPGEPPLPVAPLAAPSARVHNTRAHQFVSAHGNAHGNAHRKLSVPPLVCQAVVVGASGGGSGRIAPWVWRRGMWPEGATVLPVPKRRVTPGVSARLRQTSSQI